MKGPVGRWPDFMRMVAALFENGGRSCANKQFSHFRGLETFSPRFSVLIPQDGRVSEYQITPTNYGKLEGPYNRRNVYGVAFAYGAVLGEPGERDLVADVLRYGLCSGGPLRAQLTDDNLLERKLNDRRIGIRVTPKTGKPVDLWVECPR